MNVGHVWERWDISEWKMRCISSILWGAVEQDEACIPAFAWDVYQQHKTFMGADPISFIHAGWDVSHSTVHYPALIIAFKSLNSSIPCLLIRRYRRWAPAFEFVGAYGRPRLWLRKGFGHMYCGKEDLQHLRFIWVNALHARKDI